MGTASLHPHRANRGVPVLVSGAATTKPRRTAADPQGASRHSREVQIYRLAHVPPHLSFVAGRDRSTHESATGTDVSCLNPDDDEYLWAGHVINEERSEWEGRRDGAQALESERLNYEFSYCEILGVCQ